MTNITFPLPHPIQWAQLAQQNRTVDTERIQYWERQAEQQTVDLRSMDTTFHSFTTYE